MSTEHGNDSAVPDSNVHGAIMGPIWGRQDPGGPHVGPMNFAIRGAFAKGQNDWGTEATVMDKWDFTRF